jgi:hypothetical protein
VSDITATQITQLKNYIIQILPQAGMTGDVADKVRRFAVLQAGIKDLEEITEDQTAELLDFFSAQESTRLVNYIEQSIAPTPPETQQVVNTPFKQRATIAVSHNIPITVVLPGQKRAFLPKWQDSATTDLKQIDAWAQQYPDHNYGCVAKAQIGGFWMFETDAPEVWDRIKTETGHDYPQTFMVKSRKGRGHLYFAQNANSISMGNISQAEIPCGDWSARVHNEYCVGPGSRRDDTGTTYDVVNNVPPVEAPSWLIDWCKSQRVEKKPLERQDSPTPATLIPHGKIHGFMIQQAGRLRSMGLSGDALKVALLDIVHKWCQPPIDNSKVEQVARSFENEKYEPENVPGGLILDIKPDVAPVIEQDEIKIIPYPKFPHWIMEDTSIYRNLVKPVCDVNSRYPEFMFVPSLALLLNFLGNKLKVEMRSDRGGIFMALIGTKGQTIKSSSVEDVMAYFHHIGCLAHYSNETKTAEGRSLVWTIGSTEGFGKQMQDTNCVNGVLFFDEFKLLADKAGIESSSMKSHLLSLYEQGKFQNSTKDKSKQFSLAPNSYTATLIACTTPKNFHDLWSTFAYGAEGMDDRFFFLLEPEHLQELTPQVTVDTTINSAQTKILIEKAIAKQTIRMTLDAAQLLKDSIKSLGNRPSQRAEKWARAIAVDMGLDEITADAVRRGIALAEYELAVKKYLDVRGANSKLAAAQIKLCQILQRQPGGHMPFNGKKGLYAAMGGDNYDTKTWWSIYGGLQQAGRIRVDGKGTKEDPQIVVLLRALTEEE